MGQLPSKGLTVSGETTMLAFIRISLMGVGSKQPLMLTPLPTSAPISPSTTYSPPPFASTGSDVINP